MALQTILKLDPTPKGLRVRLTIHNNSNRYELFGQMSCGWEDSWQCDRKGITLFPHECAKNSPHTILLAPGESFAEEPWLLLLRSIPSGKTSFRFGLIRMRSDFTSQELERIYKSPERHTYFSRVDIGRRYRREKEIFWSNTETVSLRKEWIR